MSDQESARGRNGCGGCARMTRRGSLRLAGAVMGGALGCGRNINEPSGPIAAGNVSDLQVGTVRVISDVVVARDAGGVYALSAICPHAGCTVRAAGQLLLCPCHASAFDLDGAVVRGPARSALPHYQVTVASDGALTVQADNEVTPDTRLTVS